MKSLTATFLLLFIFSCALAQTREVELDEDYLLNDFDLYVTEQNFIALDRATPLCYFFDKKTGSFVKEINPEHSFPGFNWRPIKMEVLSNDIFFTNSAPWAFLISKNNDNVRVFDSSFMPPVAFKFISDSTVTGFYSHQNGNHQLVTFNTEGKKLAAFTLPDLHAKYMLYRLDKNIFLHVINDEIYFIPPLDNHVYVYSKSGSFIKDIELKISSFDKFSEDINPNSDVREIMKKASILFSKKSYIYSSYQINAVTLLLVVSHKSDSYELIYFDTESEEIIKSEAIENLPAYAKNDKLYFVRPTKKNFKIIEQKVSYN